MNTYVTTQCVLQGYYERDELYMPIVERKRKGCFQAPVVFATVLVHLSSPYSENLVYHPPLPTFVGSVNAVLQFAYSSKREGMYIHYTYIKHSVAFYFRLWATVCTNVIDKYRFFSPQYHFLYSIINTSIIIHVHRCGDEHSQH